MDTSNYSETENKRNEIKKEDKKALPKLIVLMIVSGIIGAVFAAVSIEAMEYITEHSGANLVELFHELQISLGTYSGFATFAFALVLSVAGFVIYNYYKKIALHQDINDEAVHDRVEKGLTVSLLLTNINMLLSYILFGVAFYCVVLKEDLNNLGILSLIMALTGFILQSACTSINQQKIVNLEKEMNPEKNGSVYDLQFHKKWMDSCDEAERFYTYKCTFVAYRTTQIVCMALSVILVLLGMVFPIGLLPLICVIIIWGVSSIVYTVTCMKVEKMAE